MTMAKWAAIFTALWLGLSACAGMQSNSARIYELDGRQWMILTHHEFTGGGGLFPTEQSTQIAVRQKDGTFRVIGTRILTDESELTDHMDSDFQESYVGASGSPTADFREDLIKRGTYVADVDEKQITGKRGILTVPAKAIRKASTEVETEENDGY